MDHALPLLIECICVLLVQEHLGRDRRTGRSRGRSILRQQAFGKDRQIAYSVERILRGDIHHLHRFLCRLVLDLPYGEFLSVLDDLASDHGKILVPDPDLAVLHLIALLDHRFGALEGRRIIIRLAAIYRGVNPDHRLVLQVNPEIVRPFGHTPLPLIADLRLLHIGRDPVKPVQYRSFFNDLERVNIGLQQGIQAGDSGDARQVECLHSALLHMRIGKESQRKHPAVLDLSSGKEGKRVRAALRAEEGKGQPVLIPVDPPEHRILDIHGLLVLDPGALPGKAGSLGHGRNERGACLPNSVADQSIRVLEQGHALLLAGKIIGMLVFKANFGGDQVRVLRRVLGHDPFGHDRHIFNPVMEILAADIHQERILTFRILAHIRLALDLFNGHHSICADLVLLDLERPNHLRFRALERGLMEIVKLAIHVGSDAHLILVLEGLAETIGSLRSHPLIGGILFAVKGDLIEFKLKLSAFQGIQEHVVIQEFVEKIYLILEDGRFLTPRLEPLELRFHGFQRFDHLRTGKVRHLEFLHKGLIQIGQGKHPCALD